MFTFQRLQFDSALIIFHYSATFTDIPLTSMRSVIAKRLVQSKQTSPHGHATNECNIDAISKIRKDFLQAGIKNL